VLVWFGLVWGEIVYQSRERGEHGDSDGPYVVHVSPGAVHHILFLFSPFLLLAFFPFFYRDLRLILYCIRYSLLNRSDALC
jgi:hypothetical protein